MPNALVARNGGRWGFAALIAILLLGAGLRVGEAWDGRAPVFDAAAYAAIAKNLDQGNGFTVGAEATQPSSDYSPGLPLFVAGLYKLTGGVHERLARIVLALIGTLAILFTYLLARRLTDALPTYASKRRWVPVGAALVAALVVAIYPATIEYTGMLMTEPLAATLLSGAILGILWAAGGTPRGGAVPAWRWLVPGLTLGALALVRPEYLAIGLLLALIVFLRQLRHSDWKRALLAGVVVALGLLVVVAPWTIRNAIALDRFVTVSTGGGQVLYAGTYLPSDGNPEKVGAGVVAENPELFGPHALENLRLEQILARLAEARYPGMEPDQALSKMGKEQLRVDITHHLGEYVEFIATKIGRIWSHGPRAIMRTPVWEALHWVLLGLGLLGLALLAYLRRWEALLIGAAFLAVTLISALLVASPRRVLVLIPLLSACAAASLAWLASLRKGAPGHT
jgi:4-amino-4-deoxy-L-arabinose transferase-like glycosyltransferase